MKQAFMDIPAGRPVHICTCKAPDAVRAWRMNEMYCWCTKCGGVFTFAMMDKLYASKKIRDLESTRNSGSGNGSTVGKQGAKGKMVQVEVESDFVDATFAKAHPDFSFADAGAMEKDKFKEGKEKLVIGVKAGGKAKKWSPNNTSLKYLIKKYGNDTKKWTGKSETWEVKEQVVSGEDTEVIYIKGSVPKKK